MTDFDKLIREKAEQAEYAYKPSAWKSFQHKAGLGHSTLKYWIAGISSAVIIGGVTAFISLGGSDAPDGTSSVPTLSVSDSALTTENIEEIPDDTLLMETIQVTESTQNQTITSKSPTPSAASPKQNSKLENDETKRVDTIKRKKTKAVPQPYRRPLVIDVDTIKNNEPTDEELRKGHSRLFD